LLVACVCSSVNLFVTMSVNSL